MDILGSGQVDLGPEIDWHRDFKSGYRWPAAFYLDLEVTRLDDPSDAKVPWELSRGHHLLTLARASVLFDDDRYGDELERQVASWIATNPPGYGINWTNAMEVALRAVNWVWAIGTYEQRRPLNSELRAEVVAVLGIHGRHIASNLEGTPLLRSNHYLSDILGLLVLGWALEGHPDAPRWSRYARRALEREIRGQVLEDGVSFEASLSYHGLAMEIFLIAECTAEIEGWNFSHDYRRRLRAMLDASRALRHPGGRIPLFGDGDSGRVLPAGEARPPTHDPLLWLGRALLGTPRPDASAPSEEVAWTLGTTAWITAAREAHALPLVPGPARFAPSGLYVLRGGNVHAVVRCGDVGQNGNGGHSHNDQLSYELSYRAPVVVDSGTFTYTADPAARNAFRSTSAHNTVVVDGAEVNPIDATQLFKLRGIARCEVTMSSDAASRSRLEASHSGYCRLIPPVIHRRSFQLNSATGEFLVTDALIGAEGHSVESFIHLAAGTEVTCVGAGRLCLRTVQDELDLDFWGIDGPVEIREGWVSDRFGVRELAPVLVVRPCLAGTAFGYRFAQATNQPGRQRAPRGTAAAA
jgi:hypothetical protein